MPRKTDRQAASALLGKFRVTRIDTDDFAGEHGVRVAKWRVPREEGPGRAFDPWVRVRIEDDTAPDGYVEVDVPEAGTTYL